MKSIYTNYTRYNLWANQRMASVFEGLPEAVAAQHIANSFPSVKLTFLHIWDAEFLWLNRLQGESPSLFPSKKFQGSAAEAMSLLLACSAQFHAFAEAQEEAFFAKNLSFKTISYGSQTAFAHEMIHHCMNHSTYHRGQLTMMARQLGLENLPPTDLIYFLRENKRMVNGER